MKNKNDKKKLKSKTVSIEYFMRNYNFAENGGVKYKPLLERLANNIKHFVAKNY